MDTRVDQLAALGGFLDGTDYNGAALEACVRRMADALTNETRSPPEARRIILNAIPSDRRAVVAAMLPKQTRGRPAGARVGDAGYRKAFALYDMYAFYKAEHGKHGKVMAALAELAAIKGVDQDSIKRALVRAKKRLTPADRQIIEGVAADMVERKSA